MRRKSKPASKYKQPKLQTSKNKSSEGRGIPQPLRRRQGSAVLLLTIISLPLILILTTLFWGARLQADLLDIDRALSSQVQGRLAGFNKALNNEFGLLSLDSNKRLDCFERMLPEHLRGAQLQLNQTVGEPLSDSEVLKEGILAFMRLRLPATALRTIAEQTGFSFGSGSAKPAAVVYPDIEIGNSDNTDVSDFEPPQANNAQQPDKPPVKKITTVAEAITQLLSNAVYGLLDQELKEALDQYRRYTNDCATDGDHQQLVAIPNLFEPEQLADFTELLSSAMTLPSGGLYNRLAIREYILNTFWSAGKPVSASLLTKGQPPVANLVFRNLSGSPLKDFPGRQAGEVEQILTGAKSPASAISQVKAILIIYRAALFIGRKLLSDQGIAGYQATAAVISGTLAVTTSIVIDPQILAYILLICDGLRSGFSDYSRLMHGERLSFTQKTGQQALSLNYQMHLRILLLLSPDSKLLARTAAIISKRHPGELATGISVSCVYRSRQYNRDGSLLTIEATA